LYVLLFIFVVPFSVVLILDFLSNFMYLFISCYVKCVQTSSCVKVLRMHFIGVVGYKLKFSDNTDILLTSMVVWFHPSFLF